MPYSIPAGIAGIQVPWMAKQWGLNNYEYLATSEASPQTDENPTRAWSGTPIGQDYTGFTGFLSLLNFLRPITP